jgi:hypothetical protein
MATRARVLKGRLTARTPPIASVIGPVQLPEARPMGMRPGLLKISPQLVPELMHGGGNSAAC